MQASPAKLSDGSWGVRVYDPESKASGWKGQPVTVESKGGKTWTAVLGDLVEFEPLQDNVAVYRKADKKAAPPIAGGSPEADDAKFLSERGVGPVADRHSPASVRLYVDVQYVTEGVGVYGPFHSHETAEQAVVAAAGRPDVFNAIIRNPDAPAAEYYRDHGVKAEDES